MRIFREGVKKEKISSKINEDFQLNQPEKLHFNTQKPNNNPYLLMKIKNAGGTLNGVDFEEKLRDGFNKTELTQ